jgi:hypothetical protein
VPQELAAWATIGLAEQICLKLVSRPSPTSRGIEQEGELHHALPLLLVDQLAMVMVEGSA